MLGGYRTFATLILLSGISCVGAAEAMPAWGRVSHTYYTVVAIEKALKQYKTDNGAYPTEEEGLRALLGTDSSVPYLDKVPNDPWGRPFRYTNPGAKGLIDVWSYGRDGTVGGEGQDMDIGNWLDEVPEEPPETTLSKLQGHAVGIGIAALLASPLLVWALIRRRRLLFGVYGGAALSVWCILNALRSGVMV